MRFPLSAGASRLGCEAIPEADRADAARQQLVRATLAACDAIWLADPRARLLHCDPLIHIVPDPADPASDVLAREMCDTQYQAWDTLSGRRNPELGGTPRYLDLIGVNDYHDNQWEQGSNQRLHWHLGDSRRLPLHRMLQQVWQRYQRSLLLAETSHVGSGRGRWSPEIAAQVAQAQLAGVELPGICLYPILDRPLWEETTFWTRSGLWDLDLPGADPYARQLQQRESALMTRADLVFTGSTSLYEANRDKHHQVYCFPSSVDAIHFEQACDLSNRHPLQDAIPAQRLGYYGVLDERIDLPLIAALADSHPEWQIIMVGPVVKIDPASLPQRDNIHWLGQQPYQALPQFLAGQESV